VRTFLTRQRPASAGRPGLVNVSDLVAVSVAVEVA